MLLKQLIIFFEILLYRDNLKTVSLLITPFYLSFVSDGVLPTYEHDAFYD